MNWQAHLAIVMGFWLAPCFSGMSDGLEVRVDFEEVQEAGGESPGSTRARAQEES